MNITHEQTQHTRVYTVLVRSMLVLGLMLLWFTLAPAAQAAVDDPAPGGGGYGNSRSCSCEDSGGTTTTGGGALMSLNLVADRSQVYAGQPVTMSWTVNKGQCYTTGGFNGWAQGAAGSYVSKYSSNGSQAYTTNSAGNYTFRYICYGPVSYQCRESGGKSGDYRCSYGNGLRSVSVAVSVVANPPASCTLTASPNSLTAGQDTTLSWTSNNTSGSATITNSTDGTVWTVDPTDTADTRMHAPTTNTIYTMTVQNANGTNDLCQTAVAVGATPSVPDATLTGTGCTIPDGASDCQGTFTWDITDAVGQENLHNSTMGVTYSNLSSGTNVPYTIQHGANIVQARDNSSVLRQVTVNAVCVTGTTWNAALGICQSSTVPPPPPGGTPTIDSDQLIVTIGDDVTISWDPNGSNDCTLSPNLSSLPGVNANVADSATVTVTSQSVFWIDCGGGAAVDAITVNVIPSIYES